MKTRVELLLEMGVSIDHAEQYIDDLNELLPKYSISHSKLRLAHFFSQTLHESGMFRFDMENLNYSAKALRAVFGKYFPTLDDATKFARNPEKIANKVYCNRIGNGSEASGDGWRYRGRGLMQLTGKSNYRKFSKWLDVDVVADPDLVASDFAVHSAVYYWDTHKLNAVADKDDVLRITKKINGGTNGLSHRKELLHKGTSLLSMLELGQI